MIHSTLMNEQYSHQIENFKNTVEDVYKRQVIDIYDELYHRLGGQDFRKLFPVILTDNGSEFSNPRCIENGPDGKGFQRTRIYYCNPSAPYQKAEIEVGPVSYTHLNGNVI